MRILLDQAVHDHRNKGNNALLLAAMSRLRHFWPSATFDVLSESPHFCRVLLEGAHPVGATDLSPLRTRLDPLHAVLPRHGWYLLFELREAMQSRRETALPRATVEGAIAATPPRAAVERSGLSAPTHISTRDGRWDRLRNYDLVIATGGGYMCDIDKRFLLPLMDRLEAAVSMGIPAVMVGQGVGPLTDHDLLKRAREVLPRVDYIMIREERVARPQLSALGVPHDKLVMTGDDATEVAHRCRQEQIGTGIGLGLRTNRATAVHADHVAGVRRAVQQTVMRLGAVPIAAPISYYQHESDITQINSILNGLGKHESSWRMHEPLDAFIRRIGRCRVMVSGTFHAAAFALAQGIPVIAFAHSTEYYDKLAGLLHEFGPAAGTMIRLGDDDFSARCEKAIIDAWESAESVRPILLDRARQQIELGRAGYARIRELVRKRQGDQHPLRRPVPIMEAR